MQIGWQELFLILVVGIVVVGPSELPKVIRVIKTILAKLKGLTSEFHSIIDDVIADDDIKNIKDDLSLLKKDVTSVGGEIASNVDAMNIEGNFKKSLDIKKKTANNKIAGKANKKRIASKSKTVNNTSKDLDSSKLKAVKKANNKVTAKTTKKALVDDKKENRKNN